MQKCELFFTARSLAGLALLWHLAPAEAEEVKESRCHKDNSTGSLINCVVWRSKHRDLDSDEDVGVYMNELKEASGGLMQQDQLTWGQVGLPPLVQILHDWHDGKKFPSLIYLLRGGEWMPACDTLQDGIGFRYSAEHWIRKHFLHHPLVVEDYKAADFVFLTHCAAAVLIHQVAKGELLSSRSGGGNPWLLNLKKRRVEDRNAGKPLPVKGPRNFSSYSRRFVNQNILFYEGRLPGRVVDRVEDGHLLSLIEAWKNDPAFTHCLQRTSCYFVVPSIYGRHVWRQFSNALGPRSIFLTHSGMSDWLRHQPGSFFVNAEEKPGLARDGDGTCRALCELHCKLHPQATLPQDFVLPWVISFLWTKQSENWSSRDVLVFYSGTANACSRTILVDLFRDRWKEELLQPEGNDRIVIIPPEIQVRQEDWSKLAFRSKLCICPDGDSPNTGRLIEVIMHGCVPVIISDRLQPPFHKFLNWSRFSYFLHEDDIPHLPTLLQTRFTGPAAEADLNQKREALKMAAYIFNYDNPVIMSLVTLGLNDFANRELRQATL